MMKNSLVSLDIITILPNGGFHADLYIQGNNVGRLFLNKEEKQILQETFNIKEKFLEDLNE